MVLSEEFIGILVLFKIMYFYFVVGIVFVGIVCKSKDLLFSALFSELLSIVGNETQCLDMVPRSN